MISARGGRPPPPVPPRPSKQVVAEALAKSKPLVVAKPPNNVSRLIDRTEKTIGNYVNNVIRKRDDMVSAKNAANINNNQQFVAWGGTVVYRSPSFIRDEEKRLLESKDKCKEKDEDCKKDSEMKCDVTNDTSMIINKENENNETINKNVEIKMPSVKARSMMINNNSAQKFIDAAKNSDKNTTKNGNRVSLDEKTNCKNIIHEENNVKDGSQAKENAASDVGKENSNAQDNKDIIHKHEENVVTKLEQLKKIESSPSLNSQNENDVGAENGKCLVEETKEHIAEKIVPMKSHELSITLHNNPEVAISTELNAVPNNTENKIKLQATKPQNDSLHESPHNSMDNNKEHNEIDLKRNQVRKKSTSSITIMALAEDNIGDQTRVVIGGTGSSSHISTNSVPTTTTTIEIRGGDSTTSSIISKTISNSVQITLCRPEASRSFGDAALSVRPEPEGGETEKPDAEKPRKLSSASIKNKKNSISFSDVANHELLIAELQDMRQEQRIRKRQRQPDTSDDAVSKPRLDTPDQCLKSDVSTVDDQDLDSISTSDWTEISNDGAEIALSSCRIMLDDKDSGADVSFSRERRDSGNSSSNSESPSISRMSASLPPGLPPLPKSLSGFELRGAPQYGGGAALGQSRPPPPEPPRSGRPQATLDTQLAVLRREMFGLRQLDLSLLSQLWALNESIQDFRQMLQEQDQEDDAGLLSPPSPRSPTPPSTSASEDAEEEAPRPPPPINARSISHPASQMIVPPARSAPPSTAPPPAPARPRPKPAARSRPAPPPPPPARRGPGKTSAV